MRQICIAKLQDAWDPSGMRNLELLTRTHVIYAGTNSPLELMTAHGTCAMMQVDQTQGLADT